MVWCYHPDQDIPEGHGSKAWCKGYNQLEEKGTAKRLNEVVLFMRIAEEDEI
jgi:hypothetical protein